MFVVVAARTQQRGILASQRVEIFRWKNMIHLPTPALAKAQWFGAFETLGRKTPEQIFQINSLVLTFKQKISDAPLHGCFMQLLSGSARIQNSIDCSLAT